MSNATAPKVSILVPIFNVEKYLEECLDSVVGQTLNDIEIICINDGSTDGSPEIIKRYANKDPRIVVINKKNSGYGDSMNKGLAKATGEYIGIVESDDFVELNMFENLYRFAKKHDTEVVKSNFYSYYSDISESSPKWSKEHGAVYDASKRKVITSQNEISHIISKKESGKVIDPSQKRHIFYQPPSIWAAIYKRSFLDKNKIRFLPSPGASYQDTGFNFKVWSTAKRVYFTTDAYLHYRQDNEASSVNNPGKVLCIVDEYNEITRFLEKNDLIEEFGHLAQRTKYGAYFWNFMRLDGELDGQFLEHFSKEYKEADTAGGLNWSLFDINDQRNLLEIINNPSLFLKRKKSQKKAKVSVIVPVYNVEKYLVKCLDSLLAQTLHDIEIICVDDGSTDETINILEKYHQKDPRILIHTQKNNGQAVARNRGMQLSSADFLMFCDSDDYYEDSTCETMYNTIQKQKTDLVIAEINIIYESSFSKSKYLQSDRGYYRLKYSGKVDLTDTVIKHTDVSPCNKIFRTSTQKRYGIYFPEKTWYEDASFFYKYMVVSSTAYYLKDTQLYNYVRRDGSTMSLTARKTIKAIDHTLIAMELFEFLKTNDLFKSRSTLFADLFKMCFSFSRKHLLKRDRAELYKLVKNFLKDNKAYINTVDKNVSKSIQDLLPPTVAVQKASPAKTLLRNVKKPARFLSSRLGVHYRREQHIIDKLTALEKKIDKLNKKLS